METNRYILSLLDLSEIIPETGEVLRYIPYWNGYIKHLNVQFHWGDNYGEEISS